MKKSDLMIATQIDLARRKENKGEVCAFLDHCARFGFNTVFFYLEDRIKTKSYPYSPSEESYTPSEMRELVSYADWIGIEIIPIVSNHSHTERFLRHKELAPLAELYGRIKGRFVEAGVEHYVTTCTENPLTYAFFDEYYREIAEIFPSKYFHAGLDESFDIGMCERCKARAEREGGLSGIFLDHLKHTNELLKSLGKTMMMFDDMLYITETPIETLPKDIVLCSWNYEYIDRTPGAQFRNSIKRDLFYEYDKCGLKYMPLSWTHIDHNTDSLTAYAEKYDPIGYFATTWQMGPEPLLYNYVSLANAGLLWNGILKDDPNARLKKAVSETFGEGFSDAQLSFLAMISTKTYANRAPRNFYLNGNVIVRRNVNFDDENKLDRMLLDLISSIKTDNKFINFYKARIQNTIHFYDQLILAEKLFDYLSGQVELDKDKLVEDLCKLKEGFISDISVWDEEWKLYREGIPADYKENAEIMLSDMDALINRAKGAVRGSFSALDMNLLLPDKSTRALISLDVEYDDGQTEHLGTGIYKPYATSCYNISEKGPYVYNVTFLSAPKKIKKLTVSVSSYGSAFINYFVQRIGKTAFMPKKIESFGKVQNPERLTSADTLPCEIGEGDMIRGFIDPRLADEKHGVVIDFE